MGCEEVVCAGGGERGGWRCAFLAAAYWEGTARLDPPTHAMTFGRAQKWGLAKSPFDAEIGCARGISSGAAARSHAPPTSTLTAACAREVPSRTETCARSGKSGRQSRTGEEEESREP